MIPRILRRLRPAPPSISDACWNQVCADVALVAALDAGRAARLRSLLARFLAEKTVTPAAGLELEPPMVHALGALCCLPLLELGPPGWRGWSQLIVYPGGFRARRRHVDETTGLVIEGEEDLIGEAWEAGPVVLSWDDVAADLAEPDAGFNVAIHEIAHKIDLLDGELDGAPPLPARLRPAWARDFQAAFEALAADVDRGHEPAIDGYAASAPEEFFAVCSEYHFSAPALLAEAMPAVAGHLHRFYGPSPFATAPPR